MNNTLLPCPFCGGAASLYGNEESNQYNVMCHDCESSTAVDHLSRVGRAWNRRAQPENEPLTTSELRKMDGEPVWVVVLDKTIFADKDDAINGWGLCRKSWVRLWDGARADLVHIDHDFEDYGKTWLAYRTKPERSEG